MLNLTSILITITQYCLLIVGLVLCRKLPFKGGFYFFLIMILVEIYGLVVPPIISKMVDQFGIPFGLTVGEAVVVMHLIPKALTTIAILILIIGLYKLRKS